MSGSNLVRSETEHSEPFDVNTFPISCFLKKDARGVYSLSGSCCLCDQTFRAVGCVVKGKVQRVQPWDGHAKLQHRIVQHARTHGVVGYTPHRNLVEMRLDWVRSPREASEDIDNESASRYRKRIKSTDRIRTMYCTGCAEWRRTNHFRCGASTCNTCLHITCAACGKSQKQTQYNSADVYRFLNRRKNVRCQTCRREGMTIRGSKHKVHTGEQCRRRCCTKCGVYQAVSAYRRTRERRRTDVCENCELVPCASCAAMLSRRDFTRWDIKEYFRTDGARRMTCSACKKRRKHARQQRLRIRTEKKKSKRQVYTCKHPEAHTRTCVLEPFPKWDIRRYFGVAGMKNGCVRAA